MEDPPEPSERFESYDDVARWMLHAVQTTGTLYQFQAVNVIARFGHEGMLYTTPMQMLAIDRKILTRFKKISPGVVYHRGLAAWCFDEPFFMGSGRARTP